MFTLLAAALLSLVLSHFVASALVPTVDTGYAIYIGNHSRSNTAAFLGIPYAEPPTGEGRFRAPVPLDTAKLQQNKTIFDASEYPEFCVQGTTGSGDAGGAGSEDCLKVNIYAPVNATKESKLPVLVYIHGGGYIYGNPANWPFDHWIEQSPNVVVVSVYYRLTVFGFLAHPALADPSIGSLNAGFLDQVQALKWVQSHISAFGGDPGKVTINGQSAGGSSVELHLVANEGNAPLFTGAITQSVYRKGLPTAEQQLPLFEYLLQNTSCSLPTPAEQISCLRQVSISALIRSADSAGEFFPGSFNVWIPAIDGTVLTEAPTKLILEDKWAKVPVISGATSNETGFSGNISADLTAFFPLLSSTDIQEFLNEYPESEFTNSKQRGDTITGELELRCGRELLGGAAAKANLPAFAYRYNQPNPSFGDDVDVEHAAENWMMFLGTNTGFNGSTVFTGLDPVETAFSEELIAYWLSFVRSSNPNTHKLSRSPAWSSFSLQPLHLGNRQVLQQDPNNTTTTSGVEFEEEPLLEAQRCEFGFGKVDVLAN
ncbi:alpha/beta-hydrolase [Ramaria rubella]|nr:alpha/beta-hydrolase [Ramaria rubella]